VDIYIQILDLEKRLASMEDLKRKGRRTKKTKTKINWQIKDDVARNVWWHDHWDVGWKEEHDGDWEEE
jgi:hypothetical protein